MVRTIATIRKKKSSHFILTPEIQLTLKSTATMTITIIMQKKSASLIFLALDKNQQQ
nr:MAG: hypothetical protein [Bacteriophage sp.]